MAHDRQQGRQVSPVAYERLKAWAERKPTIALMGEFSAGKSTLLNFLIEDNVLPTRATATEMPPVWFSHGDGGSYWVDPRGQQHPIEIDELTKVPMEARYARLFARSEVLEHCDVIDTPGISDPNLQQDSWRFAASQAQMVLWCTTATQAWRESERSVWLTLPERLRRHSILVVTRSDKLRTAEDRDKILRRMVRETTGLFNSLVFMATPDAVRAKAEMDESGTSPLWESSGAGQLLENMAHRFEGIFADRQALMARYSIDGGDPDRVAPRRRTAQPVAAPAVEEEEDFAYPDAAEDTYEEAAPSRRMSFEDEDDSVPAHVARREEFEEPPVFGSAPVAARPLRPPVDRGQRAERLDPADHEDLTHRLEQAERLESSGHAEPPESDEIAARPARPGRPVRVERPERPAADDGMDWISRAKANRNEAQAAPEETPARAADPLARRPAKAPAPLAMEDDDDLEAMGQNGHEFEPEEPLQRSGASEPLILTPTKSVAVEAEDPMPPLVVLWREIAAAAPESPTPRDLVDMIECLLAEAISTGLLTNRDRAAIGSALGGGASGSDRDRTPPEGSASPHRHRLA